MKTGYWFSMVLVMTSCATGYRSESDANREIATSYENLSRDELGSEQLDEFNSQAIAKYRELLDYAAISQGAEYNEMVKNEALNASKRMFITITESDSIGLSDPDKTKIIRFLGAINLQSSTDIQIGFGQLNKHLYRGEITSDQTVTLEVYLIKMRKKFGNEGESVWDIRFGNLLPLDIEP